MTDIKAIAERHKRDEEAQVFAGEAPQSHRDRGVLLERIRELEAKLEVAEQDSEYVRKLEVAVMAASLLPEKWRTEQLNPELCADELESVLKEKGDG